ncbi:MAG: N-acetylglutamate synthase [Thermoproteota archaeon]|nr:N-acetylglutamate synthase [Thermoproteota archaeon]
MNMKAEVLLYHELLTNGWPAKTIIFQNGWILRLSEGVTRRANSVLPIRYVGDNLLDDISVVERIYRERDLPVVFQIPDYFEPPNLKEKLLSLGYGSVDETLVMASSIKEILKIEENRNLNSFIEQELSDKWLVSLSNLNNYSQTIIDGQEQIIKRIPFKTKAFCYSELGNQIVAVGIAIIEREYLGIYDLIVHPDYRRRGIAQSLIAKMLQWGKDNLVKHVYLTAQGDNFKAIALYNKIGLKDRHHYRYLIKNT